MQAVAVLEGEAPERGDGHVPQPSEGLTRPALDRGAIGLGQARQASAVQLAQRVLQQVLGVGAQLREQLLDERAGAAPREVLELGLDQLLGAQRFDGALPAILVRRAPERLEVDDLHAGVVARLEVAGQREVDGEQRRARRRGGSEAPQSGRVEHRARCGGRGEQRVDGQRAAGELLDRRGLRAEGRRQRARSLGRAVRDHLGPQADLVERAREQRAHLARADDRDARSGREPRRGDLDAEAHDGHGDARELRLGAHALGDPEGLVEQRAQQRTDQAGRVGRARRVAELRDDLVLADDERLERARHAKQVARGVVARVHVRQLAQALGVLLRCQRGEELRQVARIR